MKFCLPIRFVLLCGWLACPSASNAQFSNCDPDGVQASGAVYRICMPADRPWNGDLIVFAREYVKASNPPGIPEEQFFLGGVSVAQVANLLGFAFATSGYSTNGLAVKEGLEDLVDLVDVFVAGLGTGGTLMGVGRRLKEYNANIRVVAVAPHPDDVIQGLRSLEEGFIPPILDLSLLDTRIMIESQEAFRTTRELLEREGIFAGVSAGAVVACALRIAQRMEKANIVCLLADGGWKYLSANLWTREYTELEQEIKGKVWW